MLPKFDLYLQFHRVHLATTIFVSTATIIVPELILSAFRGVPTAHFIRVSPEITLRATHGALKWHVPIPMIVTKDSNGDEQHTEAIYFYVG
jgi:hypothetical protein